MIIRCSKCGKLLLKIKLNGYLRYEIKCPRCGDQSVSVVKANEYYKNNRRKFGELQYSRRRP